MDTAGGVTPYHIGVLLVGQFTHCFPLFLLDIVACWWAQSFIMDALAVRVRHAISVRLFRLPFLYASPFLFIYAWICTTWIPALAVTPHSFNHIIMRHQKVNIYYAMQKVLGAGPSLPMCGFKFGVWTYRKEGVIILANHYLLLSTPLNF